MSDMSENTESTVEEQDALTAAAEESMSENLSVKRISISDPEELKKFKFKESVDEINNAFEVGIQVREFDNPNDPDDPMIFAVDQITSMEHSEIFDTLFNLEILKDALETNPEQEEAIRQSALESLQTGAQETYLVKQARVIYKKMVFPENRSVESILKLPLSIQHELYDACTLIANKVWRFQ